MSAPIKKQEENYMTILDLWRICAANYRWFILSLFVTLGAAAYYLIKTPNQYTREAAILVNQETLGKSTSSADANNFNNIGLVQQPTNLSNVQRHINSLDVLMEVADRLKLVRRDSVLIKAQAIKKRLKVELEDEKSTIINMKYQDASPAVADKVLYMIVEVYNEKCEQKKKHVNQHTSSFIDQRLYLLQNELNGIDDSISDFKSRNLITNLDKVSDIYLERQDQAEAQILSLSNQKAVAQYIREALNQSSKTHKYLPANSGVGSSVIEAQIAQYNSLLMQLNSHSTYTTAQNPLIAEYTNQLNDLKANIQKAVDEQIEALNIQLGRLQGFSGEATSKIASNPEQAKRIAAVERQQKVKESIYLYLLQKREENEMSMSYSSQATELIDVPHGSESPTSPNKRNVLIAAFVLGIAVPVIVLFVIESIRPGATQRNTRRRRRTHRRSPVQQV